MRFLSKILLKRLKNCIIRHYLKDMMSRTLLKRPHSLVANWYIKKFGVTIALLFKIIFVNRKLMACIKTQTQVLPLVQKAL